MLPLLTVLVMALRVSSTPENVLVVVLNKNYGVAEKNKVDTKSSDVVHALYEQKVCKEGTDCGKRLVEEMHGIYKGIKNTTGTVKKREKWIYLK